MLEKGNVMEENCTTLWPSEVGQNKEYLANLDTRLLHGIRLEMPSDEKGTSALKNNNNSTNNY